MDSAGSVVDVYAYTGTRGPKVVARLRLNGGVSEPVLNLLAGQVTGCYSASIDQAGYIKLRAQTPISNEHATTLAQNFLALMAEAFTTRERAEKVVSIDRGREYRNKPTGLR